MKYLIKMLILTICFGGLSLKAQTFGGGVPITGTTNALLLQGGQAQTNSFYLILPSKSITLSNVTSTNETAKFSFCLLLIGADGTTNIVPVATITNSFALANGGTNNGTWSTNVPSQTLQIQLATYAQAAIGNFTNNIYVP